MNVRMWSLAIAWFSLCALAQVPWPTVYYDFEDGQGKVVADSGKAKNNGELVGSLLQWNTTEGIYSGADNAQRGCVSFVDSTWKSYHIRSPYIPQYNSKDQFTISLWLKWRGQPGYGYLFWRSGTSMENNEPSTGGELYDLWLSPSGWIRWEYETVIGRFSATVGSAGGFDIFDGNWHWIVIRFSDETLSIFGDGVALTTAIVMDPLKGNSVDDLWIGARPGRSVDPSEGVRLLGYVDRFRFWDQALSDEQITTIYRSEGPSGGTGAITWTDRTSAKVKQTRALSQHQQPLRRAAVLSSGAKEIGSGNGVFDIRGKRINPSTERVRSSVLILKR